MNRSRGEGQAYRIAACQFQSRPADISFNLTKMTDHVTRAHAAGAHLCVLPECCLTGMPVTVDVGDEILALAPDLSTKDSASPVAQLQRLAQDLGMHLVFGTPERVGRSVFNSAIHVESSGKIVSTYHKAHAWPGNERFFKPGDSLQVDEGPEGFLGILICFDLEFPELPRALALRGANVLVAPMANMDPWADFQRTFARARAMENSVFVVVANTIGENQGDVYFGGSIVVDPAGQVLAEAGRHEAVIVADIDLGEIPLAVAGTRYLELRRPSLYGDLVLE